MAVRGAAPVGDRALFAGYPFLPGAETLAEELAVSLRGLLEEAALAPARELGRTRVRAALDDPRAVVALPDLDRADDAEKFLSFQYARVLLSALPAPGPIRRWAVFEAKRASGRLAVAGPEELLEVAMRLGLGFTREEGGIAVPVTDYVKLAAPIREGAFRLSQQAVRRGQVVVPVARAARLVEEGVRRQLGVPVPLAPEAQQEITAREGPFLGEIAERVPAPQARGSFRAEGLDPSGFAPCVRKMRRTLAEGENLSHTGRFALAAFLHRIGADAETIVDAYRNAPDFEEGITRYQVEHITRHNDGEGYMPPDCETLRTHGLCVREGDPSAPRPEDRARDPLCFSPELRNPLTYYRIRARPKPGAAGSGTSSAPATAPSTDRPR
ncbi:MAG: hypothetical protein ACYDFT_01070 [Thermoplasmata archaeon]